MKRMLLFTVVLLAVTTLSYAPALAQTQMAVTGAGEASFPSMAQFYGVGIRGFEFVNGVSIGADGIAVGEFQIYLLVGAADDAGAPIVVAGKATTGRVGEAGDASFEGVAAVEFANGETRTNAPFAATLSAQGLELSIDGADLPIAAVTLGSITVRPTE
jgi:hypothetical protein